MSLKKTNAESAPKGMAAAPPHRALPLVSPRSPILGDGYELCIGAKTSGSKNLVALLKSFDILADRLDLAGELGAGNRILRFRQTETQSHGKTEQRRDIGPANSYVPRGHRCGMHSDENFLVLDYRFLYFFQLEDVRGPISSMYNFFHEFSCAVLRSDSLGSYRRRLFHLSMKDAIERMWKARMSIQRPATFMIPAFMAHSRQSISSVLTTSSFSSNAW